MQMLLPNQSQGLKFQGHHVYLKTIAGGVNDPTEPLY